MTDTRTCPHPDCTEQLAPTRFACDCHWFALPTHLRVWVSRGWRSLDRPGAVEREYRRNSLAEIEDRARVEWAALVALDAHLAPYRNGPRREGRR